MLKFLFGTREILEKDFLRYAFSGQATETRRGEKSSTPCDDPKRGSLISPRLRGRRRRKNVFRFFQ